ncbi:Glyoxylase, beta-lactamase superfamily II [Pseudomonas lundensis]|jgi:glyoxylase-like metal-dependent hydrolase (beta-lactamase superfamily II)|uniref:MBL fold metallo-hydrolase n=1 Tax=Pseudomonas TaxID=286 RepID=UPI00064255AB|nr:MULTISPECIES: MBL fold metallo-hydrolase [Pseudomonas]AOZ13535.1 MBL fold metallo-hydrolase [Pseudomonas lundensis]KMM87460.1 beta-lactamase [Pseudomonas lundensis]MBM1183441.1 MBL fold metallo-hydrolase [Pseudomonas lundensis]NNA10984.1 MBL fold metallo-hydrolase [Pseudomonas lundensis]NNA19166.1 MBL fold metallo-hydrolase [Pseudomonas lundensis]
MHPEIQGFYDPATSTVSYVVYAATAGACAIIDPVLDYDAAAGRISTQSADRIAAFVESRGLTVHWLLETHAHADHLSASAYLKKTLGGQIGIGAPITQVQGVFRDLYNLEPEFRQDGSQFDKLFTPDEVFHIGPLHVRALHVPGHTPADMAYQIEDSHIFVGDTLFMPDVGTARCDFPGGDARQLYQSIKRLLSMPPTTRLYMCHDYPPEGRDVAWTTTVGEQRARNIHVNDTLDLESFVAMRTARDATLSVPQLLIPAIQINIRAGNLPPADDKGIHSLKVPLNRF